MENIYGKLSRALEQYERSLPLRRRIACWWRGSLLTKASRARYRYWRMLEMSFERLAYAVMIDTCMRRFAQIRDGLRDDDLNACLQAHNKFCLNYKANYDDSALAKLDMPDEWKCNVGFKDVKWDADNKEADRTYSASAKSSG